MSFPPQMRSGKSISAHASEILLLQANPVGFDATTNLRERNAEIAMRVVYSISTVQ